MRLLTKLKNTLLSDKIRYYGLLLIFLVISTYSIIFLPVFFYFLYKFRRKLNLKLLLILIFTFLLSYILFLIIKNISFQNGIYKVVSIKKYDNYNFVVIKRRVLKYAFHSNTNYAKGDLLKIKGKSINKYRFDIKAIFKLNLLNHKFLSKNINSLVDVEKITVIKHGKKSLICKYFDLYNINVKNFYNLIFLSNYSNQKEVYNSFNTLGLITYISFSSILVYTIIKIFKKIFYYLSINEKVQNIIIIVILLVLKVAFYNSLIILKVLISYSLNTLLSTFLIKIKKIDEIFLVFIIITIFFPRFIFSYSYKIIFSYSFLMLFLSSKLKNKNLITKDIVYFYLFYLIEIPILSQFKNLYSIYIFLLGPIFYLFFKYFLSYLISLSIFIYPISFILSKVLNKIFFITNYISSKNINIPIPEFKYFVIFIYYVLLYFMFKDINKFKKVITSLIFVNLVFINQFKYYLNPIKKCYFFNVGQGNFFLLRDSFGKNTTVIDFYNDARKKLTKMGVYKINNLIITHSDSDHVGNVKEESFNIKIDKVFLNSSDIYPKIKANSVKRVEKPCKIAKKRFLIDFLSIEDKTFVKNNNSLVCKIIVGKTSILMPGDIEKKAEKKYVKKYSNYLKSDILLSPHHGSKSSSSREFINYVNPRYVVVSCKRYNRFNFPNQEVIKFYRRKNFYILQTFERKYYSFYLFSKGFHLKKLRY